MAGRYFRGSRSRQPLGRPAWMVLEDIATPLRCGTSTCFFPRSAGHPSTDSAFVRATLSLFLGRFDVPPTPLLVRPQCHDRRGGACCRKAARIRHRAQERTGYKRPFRLDICDGGRRATMPTNARGAPTRAYLADRFRVRRKKGTLHVGRFGRARIRLRDATQARR